MRKCFKVVLAGLLLVACVGQAVASTVEESVQAWGKAAGFSSEKVHEARLDGGLGGGWRELPFTLTTDEEKTARDAISIAQSRIQTTNGIPDFSTPEKRQALQSLLQREPHQFYVEFLLGQWETRYGDATAGAALLKQAYADAPAILAQRYEVADGTPLSNRRIDSLAIECNRVHNGSLDPSLELKFGGLRTDNEGMIYVPTYRTVYRLNEMSGLAGYTVVWPKLGWFEATTKIGILPVAVATGEDGDFLSKAKAGDPPTATATLADGNVVTVTAISHFPRGAHEGWWAADGKPSAETATAPLPGVRPWPDEGGICFMLKFAKPLEKGANLRFEFSAATTSKSHYATVRPQDIGKPFYLYAVLPTEPAQVSIRMGVASGEWKLAAESGGAGDVNLFTFEAPTQQEGTTWIRVKHDKLDDELRLRAMGTDGKLHAPGPTLSGSSGEEFEDGGGWSLARDSIKAFRVETRPYQWVEFGNLATQPQRAPAAGAMHMTLEPAQLSVVAPGLTVGNGTIQLLSASDIQQWIHPARMEIVLVGGERHVHYFSTITEGDRNKQMPADVIGIERP